MSMICYKGKVLTVDSNDTVAGFLVEDKGRIVYVGNELPEQYKNVQTVELGKKVLVPAFVDTHQHMASFSTFLYFDARFSTTVRDSSHSAPPVTDLMRPFLHS